MKTNVDIEAIINTGVISNELDYERAMIADRKLRLLEKENSHFKKLRSKLRDLMAAYENKTWSNVESITEELLQGSDIAEKIVY